MDFKAVYSIDNQNQIALNLANANRFVVHYQSTVTKQFSPYQVAVGIRNITESPFSTWDNDDYVEDINFSPYIVNTFYGEKTTFSIGYGARAFSNSTRTLEGIGSFLENLNGVFLGFEYKIDKVTFMGEYDGKDINFGLKIKPNENYELNIALTEQFIDGDYNPQHENAPRRQITFGISSRNLFSHNDHYNKVIRELNEKISTLEQLELKRIEEDRKNIEEDIIDEEDVIKAKVAELFSESLLKYNQRNYSGAIKDLQKALEFDPNNTLILSRLGSVYYTYGFLDHAAYYWKKALKINPNLPELAQIKDFLDKY